MTVSTYLKDQKRDVSSKFHIVRDQLELTYELIQEQVFSKFHSTEKSPTAMKLNAGKTPSKSSDESFLIALRGTIATFLSSSDLAGVLERNWKTMIERRIDWTRGRFTGTVEKIILTSGVIREKTFLTAKGNKIIIKRSELGMFIRLFEA